jgi:hypothetical protein
MRDDHLLPSRYNENVTSRGIVRLEPRASFPTRTPSNLILTHWLYLVQRSSCPRVTKFAYPFPADYDHIVLGFCLSRFGYILHRSWHLSLQLCIFVWLVKLRGHPIIMPPLQSRIPSLILLSIAYLPRAILSTYSLSREMVESNSSYIHLNDPIMSPTNEKLKRSERGLSNNVPTKASIVYILNNKSCLPHLFQTLPTRVINTVPLTA